MACKFPLIAAIVALTLAGAAPAAAQNGPGLARAAAVPAVEEGPEGSEPITSPAACEDQQRLQSPARVQVQAMLCMIDFARSRYGLEALAEAPALSESARDKSDDILSCQEFSHFACGRSFDYWIAQSGYLSVPCWHDGENLAWGVDEYGGVRSIFRAWMRSPDHRANILGNYRQVGLALQVGVLYGRPETRVWVIHFGLQCDATE